MQNIFKTCWLSLTMHICFVLEAVHGVMPVPVASTCLSGSSHSEAVHGSELSGLPVTHLYSQAWHILSMLLSMRTTCSGHFGLNIMCGIADAALMHTSNQVPAKLVKWSLVDTAITLCHSDSRCARQEAHDFSKSGGNSGLYSFE